MNRFVYADNAATTPVSDSVLQAMRPYLQEKFGNPSSIYALGRQAQQEVENARAAIAGAFGVQPGEIFFTSGGSESDNWAIKGAAAAQLKKGKKHIITTNIEHHAVLHTCAHLEKMGFMVTYLPVNDEGYVTARQVKEALRPDTALVTIMYANNEIGTIQPIPEIGAVCREAGVWFHTDAVQTVGNVDIDVAKQNIDLLSLSGHKIHTPKGIGALYVRRGIVLDTLIDGGGQERGRRAGTENILGIAALAQAVLDACSTVEQRAAAVSPLRDRLIDGILSSVPKCRLNGGRSPRLCGNVNISFEAVEGESLLLKLDQYGICASSGSACTSGSLDPSHVLLAIGLPHEIAHGSLRLTINEHTSPEDVDYMLETIPQVVEYLRKMSPLWHE